MPLRVPGDKTGRDIPAAVNAQTAVAAADASYAVTGCASVAAQVIAVLSLITTGAVAFAEIRSSEVRQNLFK